MLTNTRHQMGVLREEAQELDTQASGTATISDAKPPGVIEQAMAGLRSKAALNTEIHALKTQRDSAQSRVQELEEQVATLSSQVQAFQADQAKLEQAIKEAAEDKQSVDEAAAAKIAAVGIAPAQLPPAGQDAQETADSLRDKLKVEKDPKERFRIQQRIDALVDA